MSIADATLAIFIVFSKFGIQHAALRFYSEFKENKRNLDLTYYYTTSFFGVFIFSLIVSVVYLLILEVYFRTRLEPQFLIILRILSLLIIFDAINSIFLMFMRAEENVKLRSIITVVRRYSMVAVTLLFVLVFKLGLLGFFYGWALVDFLYSVLLICIYFRQGKIKLKNISMPILKESLSYGLPLIGFELSSLLLAQGDRFMLQHYLGSAAVGVYSSSYNLTSYLVEFLAAPFRLAIMPIFMSIWEKKGKEETQKFLSSALKVYLMIGIPLIFATSFMGREFITLLASKKYVDGYVIMPWVISGIVIFSANSVYGAGLFLKKKTVALLSINFGSAVLNIVLNIFLIPSLGLVGAAVATLIAYLFQVALIINISFKIVPAKIPVYSIIKYIAISLIMVFTILHINHLGSAQIFIRILAGVLVYTMGILLLETQFRTEGLLLLRKILAR